MKKAIAIVLCIMFVLAFAIPAAAITTVAVKSIKLDKSTVSLKAGQTASLTATLSPANTTQTKLTYVTGNKNVATVSASGKVTAVHAGNTTITVYTSNNKIFAKCKVVVAQLDPYKVKWYMIGDKQYPETQRIDDALAVALKDINTTVDIQVMPWGDYPNKMDMITASGEAFDICFMGSWTHFYSQVAKGALLDITDTAPVYMPKLMAKTDKALIEGSKVDGKIYGLPTNKEVPAGVGIEYDKGLAAKAGADFSKVKSFDDLTPIITAAKDKLPADVFPMVFQATSVLRQGSFDDLGDITMPGVVTLNDSKTKVIDQFESKEYMDHWNLVRSWYNAGLINKNAATKGPDYWNQGKGLCRVEALGPVPEYIGSTGNTIHRIYIGNKVTSTGATNGAMMCFSKTSKDYKRAMLFFETLNNDSKAYNLVANGQEGVDYKVIDANTVPKRIDYPDGKNAGTVGYTHSGGAWSLGGDWFLSYLSPVDPADRNASIAAFNKSAVTSNLLGFSFDPEPVKNEISACTNVNQELGVPLNCGAVDPKEYAPKFIEKLKAAGMDKIIAEKQKQVDAFMAKKK